jgi:uroporphyrinogen III methyltransferase / synthase
MTVYLVGAGPGDPGLLTVRGAEILARADVVLFDRLVSKELLDLAPPEALLIDVGKRPGEPGPRRQAEINQLLVEHGRSERTVVRLKGGDPFVFGRGGEEAEALIAAAVDFVVVPGPSSAFAVPASAGVPVTHRGLSRSVTVVTGHLEEADGGEGLARLDWDGLARAGGTLVIMMGMHQRAEIARRLVSAGRSPSTPVLVVRNGTTPLQEEARCTLSSLDKVDLEAPSIIVVGEVAGLDLKPVKAAPLSHATVVVTRARERSRALVSALTRAGARVVELPVMQIADPPDDGEALRDAAVRLARGEYEWVVFSSANAVERLFGLLRDGRDLAGTQIAAVGGATAATLSSHGLVADLVPDTSSAQGLADAMPPAPPGPPGAANRLLFPRAEAATDVLAPGLRDKGWHVDDVVAYRAVRASAEHGASEEAIEAASNADVVTFTSPSTVRFFLELLAGRRAPPVVVCIGPSTAREAREAGLDVNVVAQEQSAEGLVSSLVAHVAEMHR